MKYHDWDPKKNEKLKEERDVSFEDVIIALEEGKIVEIIAHPNQKRYPGQHMYVAEIREYIYLVPFVEDVEKVFLKKIIPSRKATKEHLVTEKK